jgi:YaiO family outer membrane protein
MYFTSFHGSVRSIVLLLGLSCVYNLCYSQDSLNTEVLFVEARKLAFDNNDYSQAISFAQRALRKDPGYVDIYVFLGRLYAWKKEGDSARYYFSAALARNERLEDAYLGYADLEIWNSNDSAALDIINRGLVLNPGSVPLLLRKARVLNDRKAYREAISVVDTILLLERTNTEARVLGERINDNISFNRIGLYTEYVSFDKQFPDPWYLLSLDYTRQTKLGAFTARVNYARRFKDDGLQYELEAYPRISRTFYTFINLGYSAHTVFPRWRGGASLYANLPKAFEGELGMRYLYFTSSTFIYTAYAGKYIKSFLLGGRAYLTPGKNNIAQAYSVLLRYYFGRTNNYIGVSAGAGISPDERLTSYKLNSTYKLATYKAELNIRYTVRQLNIFTLNASVVNQEYKLGEVGNQLQLGLGYARRF